MGAVGSDVCESGPWGNGERDCVWEHVHQHGKKMAAYRKELRAALRYAPTRNTY